MVECRCRVRRAACLQQLALHFVRNEMRMATVHRRKERNAQFPNHRTHCALEFSKFFWWFGLLKPRDQIHEPGFKVGNNLDQFGGILCVENRFLGSSDVLRVSLGGSPSPGGRSLSSTTSPALSGTPANPCGRFQPRGTCRPHASGPPLTSRFPWDGFGH